MKIAAALLLFVLLAACGEPAPKSTAACDDATLVRDVTWLFPATLSKPLKTSEGRIDRGVTVLAAPGLDGRVCVRTYGQSPNLSGWAAMETIQPISSATRGSEPWIGTWEGPSGEIRITGDGDQLHLMGVRDQNASSDFEISGRIHGGAVVFNIQGCAATLQRVGEALVAMDNRACTRDGRTYTGIYTLRGG